MISSLPYLSFQSLLGFIKPGSYAEEPGIHCWNILSIPFGIYHNVHRQQRRIRKHLSIPFGIYRIPGRIRIRFCTYHFQSLLGFIISLKQLTKNSRKIYFQSLLGFINSSGGMGVSPIGKLSIPFGIYHVIQSMLYVFEDVNFQSLLGFIRTAIAMPITANNNSFNPFWDLSGVFLYLCSYFSPF